MAGGLCGGARKVNLTQGEFEALQGVDELGGIDRFDAEPVEHQAQFSLPQELAERPFQAEELGDFGGAILGGVYHLEANSLRESTEIRGNEAKIFPKQTAAIRAKLIAAGRGPVR